MSELVRREIESISDVSVARGEFFDVESLAARAPEVARQQPAPLTRQTYAGRLSRSP
jgi:hypothetical protein